MTARNRPPSDPTAGTFGQGHSAAECRELDRHTIEEFGMPGLLLMEHASIGAATLATHVLEQASVAPSEARITVLCGPGNNGGDGYAMARHLQNAGAKVRVVELVRTHTEDTDAGIQRQLAIRCGIPVLEATDNDAVDNHLQPPADLLIDAIFGTGLSRPPVGHFAHTIDALNANPSPVLAVDIPSGLDADRGKPIELAVRARWTATFGLLKKGFLAPSAAAFTGAVFCVPIGVPKQLLPLDAPAFPPAPVTVLNSAE